MNLLLFHISFLLTGSKESQSHVIIEVIIGLCVPIALLPVLVITAIIGAMEYKKHATRYMYTVLNVCVSVKESVPCTCTPSFLLINGNSKNTLHKHTHILVHVRTHLQSSKRTRTYGTANSADSCVFQNRPTDRGGSTSTLSLETGSDGSTMASTTNLTSLGKLSMTISAYNIKYLK